MLFFDFFFHSGSNLLGSRMAMQIERHLKTLSRTEKEKIIKEPLLYPLLHPF